VQHDPAGDSKAEGDESGHNSEGAEGVASASQNGGTDSAANGDEGPIDKRGCREGTQGIFHEEPSAELVTSYRAMTLFASNVPTSALLTFLGRQAGTITESLFDVFRPSARGNYYHACRILDKLLQTHRDEVSKALTGSSGGIDRYLSPMLECIEYAPVGEIFCNIICRPKQPYNIGPSSPHIYDWSPEVKWSLFSGLSAWRLMAKLAEHTYSSEYSIEHSLASATVFVELISRLSMDDNGEILLMPIAHCPELLQVIGCAGKEC
jgi:hypothetical protein